MVYKTIAVAVLLLLLSGCEHTPSWAQRFSFLQSSPPSAEQFDFNWQLSGDREVAPLQVFSTPTQVWLQFVPNQPVPAIFALEGSQQKILSYTRSEPYVVLTGAWRHLLFKGASLEAKARHSSADLRVENHVPTTMQTDPAPLRVAELTQEPTPEVFTVPVPVPVPLAESELVEVQAFDLAQMPFRAEPSDQTLRQTLKRWAQREGWLFQDQHWGLEVDLPIVSAATFSANFSDSVEQLMRSTALGSRPLQACFYSNKVMRVIALAQSCDPSETSSPFTQG